MTRPAYRHRLTLTVEGRGPLDCIALVSLWVKMAEAGVDLGDIDPKGHLKANDERIDLPHEAINR